MIFNMHAKPALQTMFQPPWIRQDRGAGRRRAASIGEFDGVWMKPEKTGGA